MKHHRRILRRIAALYGSRLVVRRAQSFSMQTGAIVLVWEVRAYNPAPMIRETLGRAVSRRDALRAAEVRVRIRLRGGW